MSLRDCLCVQVDEIDACQSLDPTTCRTTLDDGSVVNGQASDVILAIEGSAEDSAAPICPQGPSGCADGRAPQGSIINRARTSARVEWNPAPWRVLHGVQRTVDVASIMQELVARPGWQEGNSIMMLISKVSGAGTRVAESDRSSLPSLTYSFTFDGMEVAGYAPPVKGTLSSSGGSHCNDYCLDDGTQSPGSQGHTEVLTTQACADLCDTTNGCFAFEYHPWSYYCRLDSTTLDLSGETALANSGHGSQFYYEKIAGGGAAVAACSDTSPINSACPGAAAGQVVPRSCGAACANVSALHILPLSLSVSHPPLSASFGLRNFLTGNASACLIGLHAVVEPVLD